MPHSTYLPERMGTAVLEPAGSFEAGSFQSFTLTYTAGYFGIDQHAELECVLAKGLEPHARASLAGVAEADDDPVALA